MAASDWKLGPGWQEYLEQKPQTVAPAVPAPATPTPPTTTAPTPTIPTTTTASPAQGDSWLQRNIINPTPMAPTDRPFGNWAHDIATAGAGGVLTGVTNVANAPGRWAGVANSVADPNAIMSPADQAAMTGHPGWAGAGRIIGEGALTAPVVAGAAPLLEAGAVASGISNPLVRGAVTGAVSGAGQNMLTAGGAPLDENLATRALLGAGVGGLFGLGGAEINRWFGGNAALASQDIQKAGQALSDEGITILPENLPGVTGGRVSVKTTGAPPNAQQAQQIATAVSQRFGGPPVTNLAPDMFGPLENAVGQRISTAANAGQIDLRNAPGLSNDLINVIKAAQDPIKRLDPTDRSAVETLVQNITNRLTAGNGVIPGDQFDALVGAGSDLHNWVGDANQNFRGVARQLDTALDNAFQQSSPTGTYANWVNARTDYRLLQSVEKSLDHQGYINPTTLWTSINNKFQDAKALTGPAQTQVQNLRDFAGSLKTIFGGLQPNIPAAPAAPGWVSRALGNVLPLASAGGVIGAIQNPGAIANTINFLAQHIPTEAALAAAATGGRMLYRAGQNYQQSPAFANALIQRGMQQGQNLLSPWLGALGTTAAPQTGVRPRGQ